MNRRNGRWLLIHFLLIFSLLLVTACGNTANPTNTNAGENPTASSANENESASPKEQYVIRFGTSNVDTPDDPWMEAMKFFEEEVEKESNGRIDVQLFPASQLGSLTEMVEGVQSGTLTMTFSGFSYLTQSEPLYNTFLLPFLVTKENLDTAYELMDSGSQLEKLHASVEGKGVKVLGYGQMGFRNLTNSVRPVDDPSDLAGIKIRLQPNPVHLETFKLLDANPISMDISELYSAMQQKVVDAQENPLEHIYGFKMYEVQDYLTISNHLFDFAGLWMNKSFFDQLPPDLQQVVEEVGLETAQLQRDLNNAKEAHFLELLKDEMEVIELSSEQVQVFKEAVEPMYQKFLQDAPDAEFANEIFKTLR